MSQQEEALKGCSARSSGVEIFSELQPSEFSWSSASCWTSCSQRLLGRGVRSCSFGLAAAGRAIGVLPRGRVGLRSPEGRDGNYESFRTSCNVLNQCCLLMCFWSPHPGLTVNKAFSHQEPMEEEFLVLTMWLWGSTSPLQGGGGFCLGNPAPCGGNQSRPAK